MELVLFSLALAWGFMRYGATDLVATARGTDSPRYQERRMRLEQRHERWRARREAGPTIGQAVAGRVAQRIATPKPRKDRRRQGAMRRFVGEVWEQAWNGATDRVHTHRERKQAGALPRHKFARATRHAFSQFRGDGATATPTTPPPEHATECTGPIAAVAERLIPAATDTADTPPTAEQDREGNSTSGNSTHDHATGDGMAEQQYSNSDPSTEGSSAVDFERPFVDESQPPISGEVTNISSALSYTNAMQAQFASAAAHADALAAHTQQMSDWARDAATSAETSLAGLNAGEVTGEAVASLEAVHEQMTVAATRITEAQQVFAAAQEQFAVTATAFDTANKAFQRQQQVAEAYAANPDAGNKQFNTFA